MYSMAVGLDSQIYSSSSAATVLPTVRRLSDMKDSTLNSMALRTFLAALSIPLTPKTRKRLEVRLVCPLKNCASAPLHMECSPSRTSCRSFSV